MNPVVFAFLPAQAVQSVLLLLGVFYVRAGAMAWRRKKRDRDQRAAWLERRIDGQAGDDVRV